MFYIFVCVPATIKPTGRCDWRDNPNHAPGDGDGARVRESRVRAVATGVGDFRYFGRSPRRHGGPVLAPSSNQSIHQTYTPDESVLLILFYFFPQQFGFRPFTSYARPFSKPTD